ncbi:hypothetical protein B9Z55_018628 [Caenorhabditis nigoni]|uniref:Uncharacterized protein n=1 Tax=Caenorhabditis nigoni TaxID=1611254 RepID=A0A2G5TEY6_9PELO|nr:hypothetical protein B9Z55_018628 [Caenorhabditis nigoni]
MILVWHHQVFGFIMPFDLFSLRVRAVMNGLWILHCYMNPVMILIFNRPIREACRKVLQTSSCGFNVKINDASRKQQMY